MSIAFFATIAAQMGAAWLNSSRSKSHCKKMAEMQRAYEEKATLEGIENAREEFAQLCAFHKEIEKQSHLDRLALIRDNHEQILLQEAYENSLHKWPLLVPPYVIANAPITLGITESTIIPLNCILTTSSDLAFNNLVFHKIEEQISIFCSKYWNTSANKSIRFFQEAWRDDAKDIGSRHKDIYAHLKNVPTLLISPIVKNDTILFRFYWWGLSLDPTDAHINELNELNPELSIPITPKMEYDDITINLIIQECVPKLEAFISFFSDTYYWNFYSLYPSLPRLILNKTIELSLNDGYVDSLSEGLVKSFINSNNISVSDNLYYLKEISLLKSLTRDELQSCITKKISQILNFKHEKDLSLIDLIAEHNLYKCISSNDVLLLEDILKETTEDSILTITQNNLTMDSSNYLKYKNELLALLKEVQAITYLPKINKLEFEQIERKIQEDQFRIALIGEYQGGKSTTFDALCGGREISPRGNNIKTSSCKITATNLSSDEDEYAYVIWKSDVELIKTMSPILEYIDPTQFGYDSASKEVFSYIQYVDLHNISHRDLIKNTILAKSLDSTEELKDIVLVAKFILWFYDCCKDIKNQNRFTIEEASKLMTFPKDLYTRYNESNGNVEVFDESEALFAFVQSVNCHIHSNQLGELGCSFVDCPGLFASDYDTSIALETIDSSDAVLYLLDGDKQMGQDDESAIRMIFNSGLVGHPEYSGDNVFFTINQRKPDNQTSFVDLDLSQINQIGFKKTKLPLFNAFLYYYAQFGCAFLNNELDEHTIDRFLNSSSHCYNSVEKKWVKDVSRCLMFLELDEEYQIEELSTESVNIIMNISKSNVLLNEIKDYVVSNRAIYILIDNGALKILDGLVSLEKTLSYKETNVRKDVAERAKEVNSARCDLEQFCRNVTELIKDAFPLEKRKDYIEKVYNRYFLESTDINTIALDVTKNLLEYTRKGGTKWSAITSKIGTESYRKKQQDKLQTDIKGYFELAFNSTFTRIISKWLKTHYADKDLDFNEVILPLAESLGEKIKDEWNETIKNAPVLSVLCPSKIDTMTAIVKELPKSISLANNQVNDETIAGTSDAAISDVISQILSPIISTIVGVVVFHILDFIMTGGIAAYYSIIVGALTQLGLRSPKTIDSPDDLGKKGRQLYDLIKSNLYEVLLKSEVKGTLCFEENGLIKVVNEDVERYSTFYRNELKSKNAEFEINLKKAEEEYSGTKEQLNKIANEAKRIRTNEVEPLRERISKYINEINTCKA